MIKRYTPARFGCQPPPQLGLRPRCLPPTSDDTITIALYLKQLYFKRARSWHGNFGN